MPESVLEQLREELIDFRGTGIGLLEHSHRGASYDQMLAEAVAAVRGCSGLGEGWDVLFLPGGSMQHFPLIAMNFVPKVSTRSRRRPKRLKRQRPLAISPCSRCTHCAAECLSRQVGSRSNCFVTRSFPRWPDRFRRR
jgi:hypothetical protein